MRVADKTTQHNCIIIRTGKRLGTWEILSV